MSFWNLATVPALRNRVNALLDAARNDYFSQRLNSASSPARLWSELCLLGLAKSHFSTLLTYLPLDQLNSFFFSTHLSPQSSHSPTPSSSSASCFYPFNSFRPPYPIYFPSISRTLLPTSSRKHSPGVHRMPLIPTISVVSSTTASPSFLSYPRTPESFIKFLHFSLVEMLPYHPSS